MDPRSSPASQPRISERAMSKKPARDLSVSAPGHRESTSGASTTRRADPESFQTARSEHGAGGAMDASGRPVSVASYASEARGTRLSPPSPTPRRSPNRGDLPAHSSAVHLHDDIQNPKPIREIGYRASPVYAGGSRSPLPAPAAVRGKRMNFDPFISSTPANDQYPSIEPPRRAAPRHSSPDPRYEVSEVDPRHALVAHQVALREVANSRMQELASNGPGLVSLEQRGNSLVAEYANDVTAMHSRLNRVLEDNARTIQDIEEDMARTRAVLGVPAPPFPYRLSTPFANPPSHIRGTVRPLRRSLLETRPLTCHGNKRVDFSAPIPLRTPSGTLGAGPDGRQAWTDSPPGVPLWLVPPLRHGNDMTLATSVPVELAWCSSGSGTHRSETPAAFAVPADGLGSSVSAALRHRGPPLNPRLPLPSAAFGIASGGLATNSPDVVTSVAVGAVQHQDALLRQICRNIQYKVGHLRPKLPDGVKPPKVDAPDKYKGQNDHKSFYTWLDAYLNWLRAHNMGGEETDEDRVRYTPMFLAGDAAEWFAHKVDHPEVDYHPTFEEAMCAMHRRFVHATSAAQATHDYENVRYRASSGVDGFASELVDCARMMVVPPTEYDMAHRFVKGLPHDIYEYVVLHRGIRPEFIHLDDIVQHARQVEESLKMIKARDREESRTSAPATARREDKRDECRRNPAREERRTDDRRPSRTTPGAAGEAHRAPPATRDEGPARALPPHRPRAVVGSNTCFACGKAGHYANDPACPEYGKREARPNRPRARLHAQRVEDDGAEDPDAEAGRALDQEDNPDDHWGGSQYDSEEIPAYSEDEDSDGSEVERAYAMHVSTDAEEIRFHAGRMEHSATVRRKDDTPDSIQPRRDREGSPTLSALVKINGMEAYALFDSGSTTDSVSPEFSYVARVPKIVLEDQVTLQLGCTGSRSKISYGTRVPVDICGVRQPHYFDIVNLDRYDCIIGTPFLNAHGAVLDFQNHCIHDVDGGSVEERSPERRLPGHLPYVVEEIAWAKEEKEQERTNADTPRETAPGAVPTSSPVNNEKRFQFLGAQETLDSEPENTRNPRPAEAVLDDNTAAAGLPPRVATLIYPPDSERPHEYRHKWKPDPRNPASMPDLTSRDPISLHSSRGVPRDKFGQEDRYGMNDIIYEEVLHYLREIPDKEVMKPPEVIPALREKWFAVCADLIGDIPLELPPMREINHRIPIIDEGKRYNYHHPRCPDAARPELLSKWNRYVKAGWWEMKPVTQAAPMLCVLKKNGKLRTVIDARQRNDNTHKDVTPFPDQDNIRLDVARAKFRSKIDMSDAYEQICIDVEDIGKTAFSTVFGTAVSHVMQQGDCNAPGTFQRLMTWIFRDYIGIFVHVYLDDIFVYSNTIEEHERHLTLVFDRLREQRLYLSRSKLDLYSERMDCLGHIIDDRGLHADADKMSTIRDWRPPRSQVEVQRFLGLVQYLAHFLPDVSAYTSPLESICRNGTPFHWRPIHQACLDRIKDLACRAPVLKPIDPSHDDPIWVITDGSVVGVGAVYGQGPEWKTCRPAGFMSKKFTSAQRSYRTYEHEALGIIEALMKWEDRLLGRRFFVATDHKALVRMREAIRDTKSSRLIRWDEYLSRFNFEVVHVEGVQNKVADCLSRYYKNDAPDKLHPPQVYVNADLRLDPRMEELPKVRKEELEAEVALRALREVEEERTREAAIMADSPGPSSPVGSPSGITVQDALASGPPLQHTMGGTPGFMDAVRAAYADDRTFSKVLANPAAHPTFTLREGLLYVKTRLGFESLCIPFGRLGKRALTELVIDQAHVALGHFGTQKTSEYVRRWFWWPRMHRDIERFCASCGTCQMVKTSNAPPPGLLHSMPIPLYPWQSMGMDFVGPFPDAQGFNYLLVVICRLTSMVHLIPCRVTDTAAGIAAYYVRDVVRLHGLPETIVSDRDSKFTSVFWQEVHRTLGTRLLMSTAFHPQTDGASERAIRNVAQILRALVDSDQKNWVDKVALAEFAINASISATTGFSPFELNYGYMPSLTRLGTGDPAKFPGVQAFAERARLNVEQAHDVRNVLSRSPKVRKCGGSKTRKRGSTDSGVTNSAKPLLEKQETPHALRQHQGINIAQPLTPFHLSIIRFPDSIRQRKLAPKYVGPYAVVQAHPETSSYTLDLPDELVRRRIHPTFHSALLRPHEANDDALFPGREARKFYDFGAPDDGEWMVDEITGHRWKGRAVEFLVHWTLGDHTWEPLAHCEELQALDDYLALMGVDHWRALPCRVAPAA
ncbi:hypothetical protein VTO73DRAFT_3309 [Trametes versicolor]